MPLWKPHLSIFLLFFGCANRYPPVADYRAGNHQTALARQKELAAQPSVDQTLEQVRLGSMAMAMGEDDLAEQAFRGAVGSMTTFQADGEFAAVLVSESSKEWKGEPYEKMAAFLTLGTLLYASGDHGNALAMFKSSVLADTGTAEERYRSDFVPGWIMQALAYQAEGEDENARQFLSRGIDAYTSRAVLQLLSDALQRVTVEGADVDDVKRAKLVLFSALSAGVTAAPRDPQAAAAATRSVATDLLLQQQDRARNDRLAGLQSFSSRDFDAAGQALPAVTAAWMENVAALPEAATTEGEAFADQMMALLADPPSTILLIERGFGPRKVQSGTYGEVMRIVPSSHPGTTPVVQLGGAPVTPLLLDNMLFQASTRGGRGVDGFLKGKAVFKDTSLVTGHVLSLMSDVASFNDNDELAAVLGVASCLFFAAGVVTNPAADIRQWGLLPDAWYLVAADLPPGEHSLTIDAHDYTLQVPARGQLVGLIPHLAPRGSTTIAPR